ncbi:MAG: Acetoin dehydrogenase component alpha-subunit [Solirubrobacterales bacterium]|nr:Acetoin dehydrogenase component alpha-subunit [Solirubrobacterales bacterium]
MHAVTSQHEPPPAQLRRNLFASMALIRAFETRVAELYRDGDIPGFVHTSLGQEAVAAGVGLALRDEDYLATTHRGHGHCLAKGVDVDGMMGELFARVTGLCRGTGGSMHIADPSHGVIGANAIVGASLPLAVGAGLSSKLLHQDRVAVAFFGEGAVNQGSFHESVNLAAIWDLPVIFVCENNIYAEFTDSRAMTRVPCVADRAAAYGIEAHTLDGNDADVVYAATAAAAERCRAGEGPILLEAETYRWHGHYEGDAQPYKPDDESLAWRDRDPLTIAEARLVHDDTATAEELAAVRADAGARVDAAVEAARAADVPAHEEAFQHVFSR